VADLCLCFPGDNGIEAESGINRRSGF